MPTPLIIGPDEEVAFAALQKLASQHPVNMQELMPVINTPGGFAKHMERMAKQTVKLPLGFQVTYSIETGHPAGDCRHMSMSAPDPRKVPSPQAVWMVAEYLGFKGGLSACVIWDEELADGSSAINIVQPLHAN